MDKNTDTTPAAGAAAEHEVRPDVLNYDDIRQMAPRLDGHEKLVNWLLHFLSVDKVNDIHRRFCDTPGPEFVRRMLFDGFRIKLRIDGEEVLDNLPEGPFITVSTRRRCSFVRSWTFQWGSIAVIRTKGSINFLGSSSSSALTKSLLVCFTKSESSRLSNAASSSAGFKSISRR